MYIETLFFQMLKKIYTSSVQVILYVTVLMLEWLIVVLTVLTKLKMDFTERRFAFYIRNSPSFPKKKGRRKITLFQKCQYTVSQSEDELHLKCYQTIIVMIFMVYNSTSTPVPWEHNVPVDFSAIKCSLLINVVSELNIKKPERSSFE